MARTQKLVIAGYMGKGISSKKPLSESAQCGREIICLFFVPSVISTAAIAVCFLISLLLQVNWFYLNP